MRLAKVYKEHLPAVTLIGKRYTNEDRDASGTFAAYWQQCMREGWFEQLMACGGIPGVSEDFYGAMRMDGDGGFEYWIGLFLAPDSQAPDGFDAVSIPEGDVGVCWLCGQDQTGELYGMEASDMSMAALAEQGWHFSEQGWFFERYHHERFTTPDAEGNVILDIGAYLI